MKKELEPVWTKEAIGAEIIKWLPHDAQYCYILVTLAVQKKCITEEEAVIVKKELDTYYADTISVAKNKNKYMMATFEKIGFIYTRVLWELIAQFPKHIQGDPENAEMIPDNESIMKKWEIPSIDYYTIISKLIDEGYISKRTHNKHLVYKIDFLKIDEDYKEYMANQEQPDEESVSFNEFMTTTKADDEE